MILRLLSSLFIALLLTTLIGIPGILAATLPSLPQATVDTTLLTVNGTTYNATCANLQSQLNAAAADNINLVHQVVLSPAGTVCTGNIFLPAHVGGTGWIYITGPNGGVKPAGTRVTATDGNSMPSIQYNSAAVNAAVSASNNAQRYRFIGIQFLANASFLPNYRLVALGLLSDKSGGKNTGYILFDRIVCRDLSTPHQTVRCIQGDASNGNIAVIDSTLVGIGTANAAAQDAQAFAVDSSSGPLLFRNNYTEVAGESVLICGGSDSNTPITDTDVSVANDTILVGGPAALYPTGQPVLLGLGYQSSTALPAPLAISTTYYIIYVSTNSNGITTIKLALSLANANAGTAINIQDTGFDASSPTPLACVSDHCFFSVFVATQLPRDFTVQYNDFVLPTEMLASSGNGYTNTKTLFELKCGNRVLIEGNRFKNLDWQGQGFAMRLTLRNSFGNMPFADESDITVRYNLYANTANGILILPADVSGGGGSLGPTKHASRWYIHDNLFYGLGWINGGGATTGIGWQISGGNGQTMSCTDAPACYLQDFTFQHNTVDFGASVTAPQSFVSVSTHNLNLDFRDNLVNSNNGYGYFAEAGVLPSSSWGTAGLNNTWDASWNWQNNALAFIGAGDNNPYPANNSQYPANAYSGTGNFQWVTPCSAAGQCNGAYDYTLQAGSPAKAAASDGTDLGVNFTAFNAAQAGATPPPPPTPPPLSDSPYIFFQSWPLTHDAQVPDAF